VTWDWLVVLSKFSLGFEIEATLLFQLLKGMYVCVLKYFKLQLFIILKITDLHSHIVPKQVSKDRKKEVFTNV
jgi:hypothetical protein